MQEHLGQVRAFLFQLAFDLFFLGVDVLGSDGVLRQLQDVLVEQGGVDEVIEDLAAGVVALVGRETFEGALHGLFGDGLAVDAGGDAGGGRPGRRRTAGVWAEADRHERTRTGADHQPRCVLRISHPPYSDDGSRATAIPRRARL